jgi:hypothetical protein
MFKTGQFYKHENMQDVCLRIKSAVRKPEGYQLNVLWYNLRYKRFIHIEDTVLVLNEHLPLYKEMQECDL